MRSRLFGPNWFIVMAFFAAGIFLGGLSIYLWLGANAAFYGAYKVHPANKQYRFINPLLAVEFSERSGIAIDKTMQLSLEGAINQWEKPGKIVDASVYVRDIETGIWAGINENENFSPGNLLKTPIMISYYKVAQENPDILDQKLTFTGNNLEEEFFPPTERLQTGQKYSVKELIRRMIVNSDDDAANLLFGFIDKRILNEVYSDLGVNFQEISADTADFISTKADTLFYRVLYNATYLNKDYSEEALAFLVEAPSIGIGESLPKSVPTADAFGARHLIYKGASLIEMHDCGIVYYPSHPYIICLVAKSRDLRILKNFFSDLSRLVYNEIDYRYKE